MLQDLSSRNGTKINTVPVARPIALTNGAQIQSGQTVFAVSLEGFESSAATADVPQPVPPVVRQGAAGKLKGEYDFEECPSGLFRCSGSTEEVPPSDLAELLSHHVEVFLLLDCSRSGIELASIGGKPEPLFDFLEPAAAAASPQIVPAFTPDAGENQADWPTHIEESWGSDALVILYSNKPAAEVLTAMRFAVSQPNRGGVLGVCWPSVLDSLLAYDQSGTLAAWMDVFDAVMLEAPDLPVQWHLYSKNDPRHVLKRFGMSEHLEASNVAETGRDPDSEDD